jgi:hypothetical protein
MQLNNTSKKVSNLMSPIYYVVKKDTVARSVTKTKEKVLLHHEDVNHS